MKTTGFHFGTPIEICGKIYYLDLNRDGVLEKFSAAHEKIMNEVAKVKETDDLRPLVALTREIIDLSLGDGSYDSIFAGRAESSYDIACLYEYIADVANKTAKKLKNDRIKK